MESNPVEAVRNNAIATRVVAHVAGEMGVGRFVLVSTDKAVAPATVMGASKALAEFALEAATARFAGTRYAAVRFGNVLGSSGSVVPIFRRQIERGGPVTVTDERMTRYFMTIPEAVQLIIRSGSLVSDGDRGADVFVLDMGDPVRIVDLARAMIELSGLDPDRDVAIEIVGRRAGEKLHEELFNRYEQPRSHQGREDHARRTRAAFARDRGSDVRRDRAARVRGRRGRSCREGGGALDRARRALGGPSRDRRSGACAPHRLPGAMSSPSKRVHAVNALPLALSLTSTFTKVGAIAGFAALLGIALLSLLAFAQAREIKRLREWAGRAPERAAEMEQRVSTEAAARLQRAGAPAAAPAAAAARGHWSTGGAAQDAARQRAGVDGCERHRGGGKDRRAARSDGEPAGPVVAGPAPANPAVPPRQVLLKPILSVATLPNQARAKRMERRPARVKWMERRPAPPNLVPHNPRRLRLLPPCRVRRCRRRSTRCKWCGIPRDDPRGRSESNRCRSASGR